MSETMTLTILEAARELRVDRTAIFRLFRQGELPYVWVGKRRRILRRDLEAYLNRDNAEQSA